MMRLNPVMFHVAFSGDGQDMEWEHDVEACSRDQAIFLGAAKAHEDGVFLGIATKVVVAKNESYDRYNRLKERA
jgi:hypothetical protein